MSVDADLARAVAAGRLVADEPALVVPGCLGADLGLELRDDAEDGEDLGTGGLGADYAVGRAHVR